MNVNSLENKLNRLTTYNRNLQEQLEIERITISKASESLISFCNHTKDPFIPSIWGTLSKEEDPFYIKKRQCCTIM